MTNERPFPEGRPGLTGSNDSGGPCPDPEMLSAYLDGKLDQTQRGVVEDHISRCEDCYFVVRETALTLTDLAAEASDRGRPSGPDAAPAPSLPGRRLRPTLLNRYLIPLAATLVVGLGALALWRQATRGEAYSEAVRPLVEAVGERGFFEPRLTGGFKFGPRVTTLRSPGSSPPAEAWAMFAVAAEIRDQSQAASTAARASRAAALLLLGDVDQAVAEYARLVRDEPASAGWSSNLAAALLVRALTVPGSADHDLPEALRHAEQAARLDPALSEAGFNRGLALKALGRVEEARRGFNEMAERGDAWSAAARDQLRDLPAAAGPRP